MHLIEEGKSGSFEVVNKELKSAYNMFAWHKSKWHINKVGISGGIAVLEIVAMTRWPRLLLTVSALDRGG